MRAHVSHQVSTVASSEGRSPSRQLQTITETLPAQVPAAVPRLTKREAVVLRNLGVHRTLEELARMLFVSRNTVKSQVRSLYRKLGVGTREEAIAFAIKWGFQ